MLMLAIVIVALALALILIKLGIEIGFALITAAAIITLALSPENFLDILAVTLSSNRTWFLIAISIGIASLAELYRLSKLIEDLGLGIIRTLRNSKIAVILTPAVIGLLPVAGGALMSAPIIGVLSSDLGFTSSLAVYSNVWFRHTIFLVYPISQLVIVTATLSGYSIESLILRQLPVAIFMIMVGYLLALRSAKSSGKASLKVNSKPLSMTSAPLITALVSAILLKICVGDWGMVLGIFLGILILTLIVKPCKSMLCNSFLNRRVLGIGLAAFGIMYIQKAFILSGASQLITEALSSSGVPLIVLEILMPAVISISTGSPLTGIVISLPIMSGFKHLLINDVNILFVSSYVSYIGSPAHLCFVYTAQYFECSMDKVYKYLLPSMISTILFAIAIFSFM
ncbi:MAG: DUF401 family protein [archaeon GB-1867-005]|nr:DUF401 family protein [Candidatus Culexmicrobium cathedralense]